MVLVNWRFQWIANGSILNSNGRPEEDRLPSDVELDVVLLSLVVEQIERRSLRNEEQRSELQLTLHAEVLHRESVLPVV